MHLPVTHTAYSSCCAHGNMYGSCSIAPASVWLTLRSPGSVSASAASKAWQVSTSQQLLPLCSCCSCRREGDAVPSLQDHANQQHAYDGVCDVRCIRRADVSELPGRRPCQPRHIGQQQRPAPQQYWQQQHEPSAPPPGATTAAAAQ
jgi:hypothetical protein